MSRKMVKNVPYAASVSRTHASAVGDIIGDVTSVKPESKGRGTPRKPYTPFFMVLANGLR